MKLTIFLILCNLILAGYLITECASIRKSINALKAQEDAIQIMVSQMYMDSTRSEYKLSLKKSIRRNPKLKEKDNG